MEILYLIRHPIPDGRPGFNLRTEAGHPLGHYYGGLAEVMDNVRQRWPMHQIRVCNRSGQPEPKTENTAPPVA